MRFLVLICCILSILCESIGHVVVGTLGGGIKHPLLWVDYKRCVPEGMEGPLVERVCYISFSYSFTLILQLIFFMKIKISSLFYDLGVASNSGTYQISSRCFSRLC